MMIKKTAAIILSVFFIASLCGCRTARPVSEGASSGSVNTFQGYDAVLVKNFEVPANVPAAANVGSEIARKIASQIQRYSQTYKLFGVVTIEKDKTQIPAGKKVLVITGEVNEYTQPSVGKRIGRSFIPGGEFTGTAAFAAHYQFVDKDSGEVIYVTDLRTTSTGSSDTVDYAMERNAEAAARVVYQHKVGQ